MAAGKGTRLSYAKDFNKALLPVGKKSTLSHIIDKFPKEVEIVIAIGYNANLVRDFVDIAYPDRKITLVEVDKYEGPGTGPGYSLYFCRKHLQCPFIFTSADTIVLESVPEPSRNWLGVAKADDPQQYCIVGAHKGLVKAFYIKMSMVELLKRCDEPKKILESAFIGMAGVYDYEAFWKGFDKEHERIEGEVQVMDGLEELIDKPLYTQTFTWFDTGNDANYYKTNQYFSEHDFILKPDEYLYFEGNKVIKYFSDKKIIKNRLYRAKLLGGIVPEIIDSKDNFYSAPFLSGILLSKVCDVNIFRNFLYFCMSKLWQPIQLNDVQQIEFSKAVKEFYLVKTQTRLDKFYNETHIIDKENKINGVKIPKLSQLLEKIDWENLAQGVPVLFHGDLQPENVLVGDYGFKLIDWRHEFSGLTDYGDIYYDFAKLYHALIVTHEVIRKDEYEVRQENGDIYFDFLLKSNLLDLQSIFEKFLLEHGYDLNKVKILSALVYFNIAPLHRYPYNIFLYYFGKDRLYKILNEK
jgi:NDP-sugar pyrophosphorylase family protein